MGIITKNTTVTGSVFDTGEKGSQKKGTTVMRSVKKWAIAAGAAALLGTGQMAQAASVNDILQTLAFNNNAIGKTATYTFTDADRSVLAFDGGTPGTLDVGDIIVGTYEINDISIVVGSAPGVTGDTEFLDNGVNNAVFGRFALKVIAPPPTALPNSVVTFGPTSAGDVTQAGGLSVFLGGAMFEVREDSTFNFETVKLGAFGGFFDPAVTGADLYTTMGLSGAMGSDNAYTFESTDDVDALTFLSLAGETPGTPLFEIEDGRLDFLSFPAGGLGDPTVIGDIGRFDPVSGFTLGSHLRANGTSISATGIAGVFDSEVAFAARLQVIPTPAALGVGLMGLGMVALRRPRRA